MYSLFIYVSTSKTHCTYFLLMDIVVRFDENINRQVWQWVNILLRD